MGTTDRTVAEHRAAVLDVVRPTAVVDVPTEAALGLVLAEPVHAEVALPGFDAAAMDGYAVRAAEVAALAEVGTVLELPVRGDVPAGTWPGPLRARAASRVMTGAPVPAGADAVVPVEEVEVDGDRVRLRRPPVAGDHVRRAGEDVPLGATALERGVTVTAPVVGLLAALGRDRVRVHRRPRVLVLSTGAELVPAGLPLRPGAVHDANGPMLAAELTRLGAAVERAPLVGDRPGDLLAALAGVADGTVDLVVTSAGISAGAFDVVKQDLAGQADLVRVAMQPGMPQGVGRVGPARVPVITLPGNPVSAWVSAQVFVRPALDRLAGRRVVGCPVVPGVLTGAVAARPGRQRYLRAVAGTGSPLPVTPLGGQGSHLLGTLARTDALVVVPPDQDLPAGSAVQVLLPHGYADLEAEHPGRGAA